MIMAMLKAGGWGGAISCREPLCECAHLICRSYVRNAEEGVQTVGPINEHCIKRQWLIMAGMEAQEGGRCDWASLTALWGSRALRMERPGRTHWTGPR